MRQGYYAIFLHTFLDYNANIMTFSVRTAIEYAAFCSIICNGTSGPAEIHRFIMNHRKRIKKYLRKQWKGSFFDFLKFIWTDHVYPKKGHRPKPFGSCTENRTQYSNSGAATVDWTRVVNDLFVLIRKCFYSNYDTVMGSQELLKKATQQFIHDLHRQKNKDKKRTKTFHGIGPLVAVSFTQLLSLFGVIPLYCFTYAEIKANNLGPGKLIIKALGLSQTEKVEILNSRFMEVSGAFAKEWGTCVSLGLMENMFCELWRCYSHTVKNARGDISTIPLEIIMDKTKMVESPKYDVYYADDQRGCVQNLFLLRYTGLGSRLRPLLIMKHSAYLKKNERKTGAEKKMKPSIHLTNFTRDRNDPANVFWSEEPTELSLDSTLQMSPEFESMMCLTD